MGMGELEWQVKAIISEVLGVKAAKISAGKEFVKDLGADSLDMVDITSGIEKKYGIEIPTADIGRIKNLTQLIDYITPKLDAQHK